MVQLSATAVSLATLAMLTGTEETSAFTVSGPVKRRAAMTMYVPSQAAPISTQNLLSTSPSSSKVEQRNENRMQKTSLSNSVLASCDILPSFSTAHGLLSPETVMRMDQMTTVDERSDALALFLDTYRSHGPMSCLPFLSDPTILPHLTNAMRDLC